MCHLLFLITVITDRAGTAGDQSKTIAAGLGELAGNSVVEAVGSHLNRPCRTEEFIPPDVGNVGWYLMTFNGIL